jgi:hypothetical protein
MCKKPAIEGQERCKRHEEAFQKREANAGPIREGGCHAIKTDKKRCDTFAIEGRTLCRKHAAMADREQRMKEAKEQEDIVIAERTKVLIDDNIPWRLAVQMMLTEWRESTVSARVFWQTARQVTLHQGATFQEMDAYYDDIRFMNPLPYQRSDTPVARDLARIATDSQNVHTTEVASQTQKMTELLLKERIPAEQNTLKILLLKFTKYCKIKKMKTLLITMSDINDWYEKATCIELNDYLYKKLLDAAVAKIDASEHSIALYKRIYEEAVESLGMCCQGHISRLLNVFVGFDDAFKSPVTTREALQDEMATLSTMDMTPDEMVLVAKVILARLAIPTEEWSQWTDAFVEST